jgi:sigma-B regulation protein RsbU (phosphoserine phosphatase)
MVGRGPGEIIRQTNDLLVADTSEGMFVTIFLAQYDPATGRVAYVNAGHPLPRVVEADGTVRPFGEGTAPLVGVMTAAQLGGFGESEGVLGIGDTLVMYTDGVTEARPGGGPMLGDEGLDAWLGEVGRLPVDRVCAELVRRVDELQGGVPADDVTVVALRRNGV